MSEPEHIGDILRLEMERMEASLRGEWQPIETAPQGIPILVCIAGEEYHPSKVEYSNGEWYLDNLDTALTLSISPTHWMPLPDPPAALKASDQ